MSSALQDPPMSPEHLRGGRKAVPGLLATGVILLSLALIMFAYVVTYRPALQHRHFGAKIENPATLATENASSTQQLTTDSNRMRAHNTPYQPKHFHHVARHERPRTPPAKSVSSELITQTLPTGRRSSPPNQISTQQPSPFQTGTSASSPCVAPTPPATIQKKPGFFKRILNTLKRLFGRGRRNTVKTNSPPILCALNAAPSSLTLPCPQGTSSETCPASASREIILNALAADADKDTLLYTWSVTGGRLSGEGNAVTWDLSGVNIGTYAATVEVNDGDQHAVAGTTVTVTECRCAPPCPSVSVSCPSDAYQGAPITFTASVSSDASATYNWSVSAGAITSGQGTSSISVDSAGLGGQSITATLELGGLDLACSRTGSCSTSVMAAPFGGTRLFDRYGHLSFEDEKVRLDNFAMGLQADPSVGAAILAYGTCAGEAVTRTARAKNYLVSTRGVEGARINISDAGCREEPAVELWLVPQGTGGPSPTNDGVISPCPECKKSGPRRPSTLSKLSGRVLDPDGAALPSATIVISGDDGFRATVTTDRNGHFEFNELKAGTYTLEITAAGFGKRTRQNVVVKEGENILEPTSVSVTELTTRLKEQDLIRVSYPDHFLEDPEGEITFALDREFSDHQIVASETNTNGRIDIVERPPPIPGATPNVPTSKAQGDQYTAFATVTLISTGLTVVSPPPNSEQSLSETHVNWTWKVKPADSDLEIASFCFHVDIVWRAAGRPDKFFSYDLGEPFRSKIGPPKSVTAATYGAPLFAAAGFVAFGVGFRRRRRQLSEAGLEDGPHTMAVAEGIEEEVSSTVFAPRQATADSAFLVQVFAHLADQDLESLKAKATEADEKTRRVGSDKLDQTVRRGATLTFRLKMDGLEIDEPQQDRKWKGQTIRVQFGVTVPKNFEPRAMFGLVVICADSMPIGHFRFAFEVVRSTPATTEIPTYVEAVNRYKKAFISYAHEDRVEVLKRVQMLDILRQKYFQDFITLRPGDKWESFLYEAIDRSDVVYLFWSTAASRSEWVRKEVTRAVERRGGDENAPPAIYPVIIEGPPPAKPPDELSFLHFDDQFSYWIFAAEGSRAQGTPMDAANTETKKLSP